MCLSNGNSRSSIGYFFFSSRRRHTRFDCDWSSDVCSSDLPTPGHYHRRLPRPMFRPTNPLLGAAPAPGRSRPKGGDMPRRYETVYIFDSVLEEPAIAEKLEKFHALLTKDGKGAVSNVAHWGN